MTKDEALTLYARAAVNEEWEAAAHALAAALNEAKPVMRAKGVKKKNVRRGAASRAYAHVKLPVFQKQNCGHWFNSSGCAVCPYCPRTPTRFVEGPYTPPVVERRNAMLKNR